MCSRRLLQGLLTMVLLLAFATPVRSETDITGTYTCVGTNPGGQTYRGKVGITKKGDVYYLAWVVGKDKYVGIGIRDKDVLAVSFYGGATGVVMYRIQKGPKLLGKWTFPKGGNRTFTENLSK